MTTIRAELAAVARAGRVARLAVRAARLLAASPSPFAVSDARRALGIIRRVVVLVEHLDVEGVTRRRRHPHIAVNTIPVAYV